MNGQWIPSSPQNRSVSSTCQFQMARQNGCFRITNRRRRICEGLWHSSRSRPDSVAFLPCQIEAVGLSSPGSEMPGTRSHTKAPILAVA
jgi:hypothetical protein